MQTRNVHIGLTILEQRLQREMEDILRKDKLMWFQRWKAKWLTDGDRNTKYYHIKVVHHRR